jgi:hypothetical protein
MAASEIWILISVVVLAAIAVLVFFVNRKKGKKMGEKLTPLTGLAFGLVVAGMVFGDDRLVGYGLMGAGVAIAVIDMLLKMKAAGKGGKTGK